MSALALVPFVLLATDPLERVTVGGVSLKAPAQWAAEETDSGREWAAPGDDAKMAIDVFPVDPQRPAKACVRQMVEAIAKDGFDKFELTTVAGQPAAKRVMSDYLGEGEDAKTEANKVVSTMVLGCNGRAKWVLTWTARANQGSRFGPMIKRILDSISYGH